MPPYDLISLKHIFYTVGIGLIIVTLVILARATPYWSFTFRKRTEREIEEDVHEFGGGVTEKNRPMPLLIWVIFIAYFIWAAGYVIYISFAGY